jgi:uncharacterized protein DUF5329
MSRGARRRLFWLLLGLFLPLAAEAPFHAESLASGEKQKIEAIIKAVSDLKDARFIRNGSAYDVSTAVRFLRGKWEANDADIKTARDFIDRVASVSGTSGKPYLIRFRDGREIKSRDFLLAQLEKLDSRP